MQDNSLGCCMCEKSIIINECLPTQWKWDISATVYFVKEKHLFHRSSNASGVPEELPIHLFFSGDY